MEIRLPWMTGGSSSPHRRKGRLESRPFFVLNQKVKLPFIFPGIAACLVYFPIRPHQQEQVFFL